MYIEPKDGYLPASVYEVWDRNGQRRWHTDMQHTGLRLAEEKAVPPREIPEAPKRFGLRDRIQQAYAVLCCKAYARPLRQPQLLKPGSPPRSSNKASNPSTSDGNPR